MINCKGEISLVKRKLITFLGTGKYIECIYTRGDDFQSRPTKFVQTALFEALEHEGEPIDEVYLFVTKEAKEKNLYDSKSEEGELKEGLRTVWDRYFPEDKDKLKIVHYSSSQSEQAQWDLFEKVFQLVGEKDRLYFDITHSFRFVPVVALLVANFARTIRGASIERLLYGNFEILFQKGPLDKLPLEERKAPLVDITPMLNLLEWTTGVQSFLETGNPKGINHLTDKETGKSGGDKNFIKIKQFSEKLSEFNQLLGTSRGKTIHKVIPEVKNRLAKAKEVSDDILPQFSKLIGEIDAKLADFGDDKVKNMWATIKWCVDHGLYQQAMTFAREYIISVTILKLEKEGFDLKPQGEKQERDLRDDVNSIILHILDPKDELYFKVPEKHEQLVEPIKRLVESQQDAFKAYSGIVEYRNSMNHAEKAQNPIKYTKIQARTPKFVEDIKPIFFED